MRISDWSSDVCSSDLSLPCSTTCLTRAATLRIRSMPAIDVPPNFITMRAMICALFLLLQIMPRRGARPYSSARAAMASQAATTIHPDKATHLRKLAHDWWKHHASPALRPDERRVGQD